MKRFLLLILASVVLLAQGGCGGGGGGYNGGGGGGGGGTSTSTSGTAALGLIKNGTVKVYALNADGSQGSLLATASTNGAGQYSASLGSYSGPIIAYAYGSYTDEATGATVTLTEANALRAALPSASGNVALAVTGLTEIAVRKAGSALTSSAISSANSLISTVFKVDVTGVNPVEPTAAALGAAGVTSAQRNYTLALAAVAQLATTTQGATAVEKLSSALNVLTQGIGASMNPATAAAYTQALHVYLQNDGAVNGVVTDQGGSPIITVGSGTGTITLNLSTTATSLRGATLTVNLPPGVTVHAQSDGTVSNGVLGLTSSTGGSLVLGKFTPSGTGNSTLQVGVISGSAIPSGSFLIVNADVAAGTVVAKEAFSVTGTTFADDTGSSGSVTASVTVGGFTQQ